MEIFKVVVQILSLVGALGLFLYGMKTMSEAIQKIAGSRMRLILSKITANPFRGILAGFVVTGLIQSSSATTVMVVSFVNAGLISFAESLGVIFGANIGTTITAWFISLLGFSSTFDIYTFLLPLVAVALPLFFSKKNALSKAGFDFIMGFVLLFLGIYFFKINTPHIDETSSFFQQFQNYRQDVFVNVLLFVFLGFVITSIFQSSSATIALTIVLATEGWISLDYALAMVLGENVGTTVTANIAAIVANKSAKRTALAHFLFNALGIWWVLLFFGFFTGLIQSVVSSLQASMDSTTSFIPVGISIFHTAFNGINTLLFTLFLRPFERLCYFIIKNDKGFDEKSRLSYINSSLLSVSELSVLQANREIAGMSKEVTKIFQLIPDLLVEKNEQKFSKKINKIAGLNGLIITKDDEVASYLTRISQDNLSVSESGNIRLVLKIGNQLKSIAGICNLMAFTVKRKNEAKAWFTQEMRNDLLLTFGMIVKIFDAININLQDRNGRATVENLENYLEEIHQRLNSLKMIYLEEIKNEALPYQTGLFFNELLVHLGEIATFVTDINKVICESHSSKNNRKIKI